MNISEEILGHVLYVVQPSNVADTIVTLFPYYTNDSNISKGH